MSGRVGPLKPSFINTYSLDFDGMDDYMTCGYMSELDAIQTFTISMWVKFDNLTGTQRIIGKRYNAVYHIACNVVGTEFYPSINGAYGSTTDANLVGGTWYHIAMVFDGTLTGNINRLKLYVDGIQKILSFNGTIPSITYDFALNPSTFYLGTDGFSTPNYYGGKMDEVSIFDTPEPIANLWDGSGKPTDLTSLNPIAWYRMGDNGAYKDPQWLIPPNENKDKVSNYSMDFDGVDDYINCGDLTSLVDNKSKLSISYWVNFPNVTEVNRTTGKCSDPATTTKWIDCSGYLGEILFVVAGTGLNESLAYALTGAVLTNNTWHHVVCVFDGTQVVNTDRVKIYVDNVDEALTYNQLFPSTTYDFTLEPTNPPWYIGQTGLQLGNNELRGMLDEYAIYSDVALTATMVDEIFNEGTPKDLTTLPTTSSPDLWYKMGENATYTTVWNIPDEIGSNDVTTIAMTIEDRVGTAPSSSNNSLSFNMDLIDRVEDTP